MSRSFPASSTGFVLIALNFRREAAIMADVSLPGDTGAFMDYTTEDSRGERQGGDGESLRKLRTQQAKARKKSRAQAKSQKRQVGHSSAPGFVDGLGTCK